MIPERSRRNSGITNNRSHELKNHETSNVAIGSN
jgi:hypothetical protein